MSKVLVTEQHLMNIAAAIREKLDTQDTYRPGDMAAAIREISGYPEPTGTVSITQNGTANVKDYATAAVNVPNSYAAGDEGKVVSNGALVAQTAHATVTENGTIDTTLNNSVVVNVSGGGGTVEYMEYCTFYGWAIELPVMFTANISTYLDGQLRYDDNYQPACGTHDPQNTGNLTWNRVLWGDSVIYAGNGTLTGQTVIGSGLMTRHVVEHDAALHEIRYDGVKKADYNPVTPAYDMPLTVGGHYMTTPYSPFTGKIYRYKAIDATTGNVLIDLRPAKLTSANGEFIGLYDDINGIMYPVPVKPW